MTNPTTGSIDVANAALDTVKFAKLISKTFGRTSLTRSAKDTIAQFPCIMSGDIPLEDSVTLAKSIEAQYAALLVSVISMNSDYDRAKFSNPADYLKQFHNNSNIPRVLMTGLDSQLPGDTMAYECDIKSAKTMPQYAHLIPKELAMECWAGDMEKQFKIDTLNSKYRPETATQKAMEQIVADLRKIDTKATEASGTGSEFVSNMAGGASYHKDNVGAPTGRETSKQITRKVPVRDANGNIVRDAKGNPILENQTEKEIQRSVAATGKQSLAKNDKLTSLEPSLINLTLTSHHGGSGQIIEHNVIMGVKAMTQVVPQDIMVKNLIEGVTGSRRIFALLKWTQGQYSFIKDFLLGIGRAKEDASARGDMAHWIREIRRRKKADLASRATGASVPPIVTVVCTTYEVELVKEATGMDLSDSYTAAKMMSAFFMLGFMIYDPESGEVKALFDGDTRFNTTTIGSLKTKQQRETELTQFSSFLRAAGKM